jgi:hypothetical protein
MKDKVYTKEEIEKILDEVYEEVYDNPYDYKRSLRIEFGIEK